MATTETRIENLIGLHERNLLTEVEAVSDFLLITATVDDVQCVTMLFDLLPATLQSAVRSRLNGLQTSEIDWRPFMIGGRFNEAELERQRSQLRQIHALLCGSD